MLRTTQSSAPSRAAIFSSSTRVVGLPYLQARTEAPGVLAVLQPMWNVARAPVPCPNCTAGAKLGHPPPAMLPAVQVGMGPCRAALYLPPTTAGGARPHLPYSQLCCRFSWYSTSSAVSANVNVDEVTIWGRQEASGHACFEGRRQQAHQVAEQKR